ncbi:MAG TPA: redoxin domain-containing protein [Candidatus Eisenbacteria bacterium]|nr:redoxin domain-containing protein [Candidatus Eisenbacteria bacterium]
MKFTLVLAIAVMLAANDPTDRGAAVPTPPTGTSTAALHPRALETPATEVCLGDAAPNVAYQGADARWLRLKDITTQGAVLLVIGADQRTLRVLEQERETLMDLGVIPVAVLASRLGVVRATTARLGLRYTVIGDPQGVIAAQFNALDGATGRHLPAWFVLDAGMRVRGLGRKALPARGYSTLAAQALGVPEKDRPVPTSTGAVSR